MKLILLGAPGAGKGTQAEKICQRNNIPTISTGNILREALKSGTEMGLKAKTYMESGQLVPDEILIGIIKDRLAQELQEARARLAQWEETSQEARQRRECQELERERDSLIGDIKALRRFRESFRQAVEEDAQSLLRRAESLPSEKLL